MDKEIIFVWRGLPNLLSVSRIFLGPIVILFYSSTDRVRFTIAIGIVVFALVTDLTDGYLARKLGLASEVGYTLDGLGDRAMYIALTLALLKEHELSLVSVWLIIFREILLYAMRLLSRDWYKKISEVRVFSLFQGVAIRLWFLTYFLTDGFRLYALMIGQCASASLELARNFLLYAAIAFGYYHLYLQSKLILPRGTDEL